MRDVAASLVCHDRVAENGVRETVRTPSMVGGGPLGAAGVVLVLVGEAVGGSVPLGNAMKVRSRAYGALYVFAAVSAVGSSVLPLLSASDSASTPESGWRPGLEVRP